MSTALTSRQEDILAFLRYFMKTNGYAPSVAEVSEHFGWKSGNAADEHLKAMEKKGAIRRTKGVARSIVLTTPQDGLNRLFGGLQR